MVGRKSYSTYVRSKHIKRESAGANLIVVAILIYQIIIIIIISGCLSKPAADLCDRHTDRRGMTTAEIFIIKIEVNDDLFPDRCVKRTHEMDKLSAVNSHAMHVVTYIVKD